MLAKKVDTLSKAMEVEARKMRREVASMEKEVAAMRISKEHDHRAWQASAPRGAVNSQSISSRSIFYLFVFFVVILCFLFLIVNYKNIYFFLLEHGYHCQNLGFGSSRLMC